MMDLMFNILFGKEGSSNGSVAAPSFPGSTRDGLITTCYKLHKTRMRLLEPYRRLKNALRQLQEEYLKSKEQNALVRYIRLQHIVREVVVIEKQYWKLLDIPTQDVTEDPNEYVNRIVNLLEEKSQQMPKSGGIAALLGTTMLGKAAESSADQKLFDSLKAQATDDLRHEHNEMYGYVFRLVKKYLGLRRLVHDLAEKYEATRFYPIVPRYTLLKNMIKCALRAPEFAEICHEQTE